MKIEPALANELDRLGDTAPVYTAVCVCVPAPFQPLLPILSGSASALGVTSGHCRAASAASATATFSHLSAALGPSSKTICQQIFTLPTNGRCQICFQLLWALSLSLSLSFLPFLAAFFYPALVFESHLSSVSTYLLFALNVCACLTAFNLCLSVAHYLRVYLSLFKQFFIIFLLFSSFTGWRTFLAFHCIDVFSPDTLLNEK